MKKGKMVMIVTIGCICFILSLIMFMQFKVVNETDITAIENMRETELRTELSNWKEKYEEINLKYQEVVTKINEYDKETASDAEKEELLNKELEQANIIAGKTDVEGKGIIITINESEEDKIEVNDLLIIINTLKASGAEAISINDERIVNMTDIVSINDTFIKVNSQRIEIPYVIKAIGNQTYLEGALLGSGGYVDELKKLGYNISMEKDNMVIYKYEDEFSTKYIS